MRIDLNILNHLGINLYSNKAAVLSEAVANAWDADATRVDITINDGKGKEIQEIVIRDNGCGMDLGAINDRFLTVGYGRRKGSGDETVKKRKIMGRKGIGKLSFFSLADVVQVHTAIGGKRQAFEMSMKDIKKTMKTKKEYRPRPVSPIGDLEQGTCLVLREIDGKRWDITEQALRERVSRRFSVIGRHGADTFEVYVNGELLKAKERADVKNLEFFWEIGKQTMVETDDLPAKVQHLKLDDVVSEEHGWKVTGWIGAVPEPKDLKNAEGDKLNGLVVLSRGRLIQEDILKDIGSAKFYANYLTGQLQADFLDDTKESDIATSDRQRVIEDDPRYKALLNYLKAKLTGIDEEWNRLRGEARAEDAIRENPVFESWIGKMKGDQQRVARKMLGQIRGLPDDSGKTRKAMYKAGVLAFERLRLRDQSAALDSQTMMTAEHLLPLLSDASDLEASMYRDIIKSRLDTIRHFIGITDDNEKERVLQQHMFKNLWLLDAAWEAATDSLRMEKKFLSEFWKKKKSLFKEVMGEDFDKAENKRYDLRYKTVSGEHILVELKRPEATTSLGELIDQGEFYREILASCLKHEVDSDEEGGEPIIRLVFVVGPKSVRGMSKQLRQVLVAMNARVITYDMLISRALTSYGAYLDRTEELDSIDKLIHEIDGESGTELEATIGTTDLTDDDDGPTDKGAAKPAHGKSKAKGHIAGTKAPAVPAPKRPKIPTKSAKKATRNP
ncbi:ATP-binding protein [Hymenobacter sp. CA1UV-4]|nr:ATP-binding protein [Hymenobacter sp. CA1UV-4]